MMPGQQIRQPGAPPKKQRVGRQARPIRPGKKSLVALKRKGSPLSQALGAKKPAVPAQAIPSALGMPMPQMPISGGGGAMV